MKTKKKQTNHNRRTASRSSSPTPVVLPFIEHAHELRRRLYYVIASLVLWGGALYSIQKHVVNALLQPAKGQHFIYTTPGGGVDFLFRICVYGGLILSLPVIVYNSLRFMEPLIADNSRRFIILGSLVSGVLAMTGMFFGYFVGLPAALHFLLHQFTTVQIQPLVTIQSYLHFVIVYMVGSALLFQLPLFLIFINRIKPLKPKRLLHYERWVILAAFVLASLMNPTPNIMSQMLVAGPFIVMYQLGILLIVVINRPMRQPVQCVTQSLSAPAPVAAPIADLVRPWPRSALISDIAPQRSSVPAKRPIQTTTPQPKTREIVQPRPRQRFMDFIPQINQELTGF